MMLSLLAMIGGMVVVMTYRHAHAEHDRRAYQKVGFRRCGIVRKHERGSDGVWHDGQLAGHVPGRVRGLWSKT